MPSLLAGGGFELASSNLTYIYFLFIEKMNVFTR